MSLDKSKTKRVLADFRLFFILILLMAVLSLLSPRFLSLDNLTNVLWSVCIIGIMCTGFIYSPVTGGIDLSVGSMAALSGIIANVLMNVAHLTLVPALLLTLGFGLLVGLVNGIVTTKFRVPPFIVTMAAKTYLFGIAMLVSNGDTITIMGPKDFLSIGVGKFLGLPIPIYIMLVLILASHFLLKHTLFGRRAIAVGANEVSAKLSGVNPDNTRIVAYILSSGAATIAGIVMASLTQQAYAPNAAGYEFDVITAVVIGGIAMSGGRGNIWGAIVGALILGLLNNIIFFANVPSFYQNFFRGMIVIFSLTLGTLTRIKELKAPV